MSKFLTNPALKRPIPGEPEYNPKGRPWVLLGELRYQSDLMDGEILIVPEGYRSDMASVPWAFRRMFPQDGPWSMAAVLHDMLCDFRLPGINNKLAAEIFREAMEVLNVPKWKRDTMYRAVLWFGPKWDS